MERRFAGMRLSLGRDRRRGGHRPSRPRQQQPPVYVITDAQTQQPWWKRGLGSGGNAWRQTTSARRVPVIPITDWTDPQHAGEQRQEQQQERRRPSKPPVESTWHRNRRQVWPWLAALPVAAVPIVLWLPVRVALHFGAHHWQIACVVAVLMALAAGRAAQIYLGRAERRWRRRIAAAAVFAVTWVTATVWTGLDLVMYAALVLATGALSGRWWQTHRTPNPTQPPAASKAVDRGDREEEPPDQIVTRFNKYATKNGGPAYGCRLTNGDVTDARASYTMLIRPGDDDLASIQARRPKIATALGVHPEDLIIERHPTSRESTHLRLTVITRSPVEQTVEFTQPRWVEDADGNAFIELGTYADGDGATRLPIITEHTSAENAMIVANRGGGKSTLLLAAAITARSSGRAMLIYLDGKGGASSPVLMSWADWAPIGDTDDAILANGREVLGVLEKILQARRRQAMVEGISGITPTADRPLIIIVVDESHKFFNDPYRGVANRWRELLREMRAFAMAMWGATQGTKIDSYGGDSSIKEFLGGNAIIVGRLRAGQAAGLLGVPFDPSTLSRGGGHFFIEVGTGRSAPWRAWRVRDTRSAPGVEDSDADEWFARMPARSLEQAALSHMPAAYTRRAETAAQRRAALAAGRPIAADAPASPSPVPAAAAPVGAWRPRWPSFRPSHAPAAAVAVPDGLAGTHARVWSEIAAGRDTVAAICTDLDLGKSRVHEVINELIDAGHVHRPDGKGRYETTGGPKR